MYVIVLTMFFDNISLGAGGEVNLNFLGPLFESYPSYEKQALVNIEFKNQF